MGNTLSEGASPMAISAMSNYTHCEKHELGRLRDAFQEIAGRRGNPMTISRSELAEVIQQSGIVESDAEVLDRLFTMFEYVDIPLCNVARIILHHPFHPSIYLNAHSKTGDDAIYYREFSAGLSPLISADVKEKVDFAMQMYDVDTTGTLKIDEIVKLLSAINRTASYFGDPCLTEQQVIDLTEESFNAEGGGVKGKDYAYSDYINAILDHPNFIIFVTGKGEARYGLGIS